MAATASIEILDLRHFAAPMFHGVLDTEAALWKQRLNWDYRTSTRLLLQYLDSHMLPGYAAVRDGRVIGYAFCVYEDAKAVIGDVFAGSDAADGSLAALGSAHAIEETLLKHLLETLLNSPQIDRIESQILLLPAETHAGLFRQAGFRVFRRLFMVRSLQGSHPAPAVHLPAELLMRPWRDEDLAGAAELIAEAYSGHPDSQINDQYCSVHGSMRFLNNIVRYSGCGVFCAPVSLVIVHRQSRELVGLLLGSRVSQESGHITQICVHPSYRRCGLARTLLSVAHHGFVRQGVSEISLTVTEANSRAIELYLSEGYTTTHRFDAAVWERPQRA